MPLLSAFTPLGMLAMSGKPSYGETLYKGLSQYSQSLSHFEVAHANLDKSEKRIGAGLN